jgi:repressor LexA
MIGRGINDGDFVLVSPRAEANDGDVIAARLGEDATVKTLAHEDGGVLLKAANPEDRDIAVGPDDDFAIIGVVCGIFRPFFDRGVPDAAEAE